MNKLRKSIIAFISLITVLIVCGVSVYAYYRINTNQTINASTAITSDTITNIASYDDLFANSKASAYNDKAEVATTRKILKLTADITLIDDLVITADVHLDLGTHKLNLNNHVLTFKHGYAGCFSIYNGEIESGTSGAGYIVLDMPNAGYETSSLTAKNNGTAATLTDYIRVLNLDNKYTAYSALFNVANVLATDLNKNVEFADYDTVHAESYTLTPARFITSKTTCEYKGENADESCSFVYKDLDLPNNYLSTDVSITYTADGEYLSNNGNILKLPTTIATTTLKATVSIGSDYSVSVDFPIHIVNVGNDTVKEKIGKSLLLEYLKDYHQTSPVMVSSSVTYNDYYEFDHYLELPTKVLDGAIAMSYEPQKLDGTAATTTSGVENGIYLFAPNVNCLKLAIKVGTTTVTTLDMYTKLVGDEETVARLITNELYGGSIVFDMAQSSKELTAYSSLSSNDNIKKYVTNYNITNMTYALKSDAATTYNLSAQNVLTVKSDTPASRVGFITITFTFGTGATARTIDIDLYIEYVDASGSTLSSFITYYNEYDPKVSDTLTSSFEMPFAYDKKSPYVCYDFAVGYTTSKTTNYENNFNYYTYTLSMPSSISVVLYYDGANRITFSYTTTSGASLTTQLDSYCTTNSITLAQIGAYADAKYIITLNAQSATVDNIDTLLIYNYKFNSSDASWTTYQFTGEDLEKESHTYMSELTCSYFVTSGGLFYNNDSSAPNAIKNQTFFRWIYNHFNPTGETMATSVTSTSFIPKDWLSLDVEMDIDDDSTLREINNFSGIGNLTSITKVDLHGVEVTSTVLSGICSMSNLTELNLSGCSLNTYIEVDSLNIFKTLTKLKTLDISNNNIRYFEPLVDLTSLEAVYLYNNADTSNVVTDGNTKKPKQNYGSSGICNFQAFNDLMRNGTSVYNKVSNGVPVLFAESNNDDDYKRLKEIAYQDKLSTNVSIEQLYNAFKTIDASGFGLSDTTGTLNWGYGGTGTSVTVYNATYFYVTYEYSGYVLKVKYYVSRY